MSTLSVASPILKKFVEKLKKEIPCWGHYRSVKAYSLKKCDTMTEREMRHFATVHDAPTNKDFRIVSKELYADNWCRTHPLVKHKKDAFGKGQDGLEFHVGYNISGSDYQLALEILRRTKSNLPPCSPQYRSC